MWALCDVDDEQSGKAFRAFGVGSLSREAFGCGGQSMSISLLIPATSVNVKGYFEKDAVVFQRIKSRQEATSKLNSR